MVLQNSALESTPEIINNSCNIGGGGPSPFHTVSTFQIDLFHLQCQQRPRVLSDIRCSLCSQQISLFCTKIYLHVVFHARIRNVKGRYGYNKLSSRIVTFYLFPSHSQGLCQVCQGRLYIFTLNRLRHPFWILLSKIGRMETKTMKWEVIQFMFLEKCDVSISICQIQSGAT